MKIAEHWIEELRTIREFKLLADIEDAELADIHSTITNLINDQFIETATEKGIARRERILKIVPFADDSIDDRRFRVLSRWNSKLPYTYRGLLQRLDQLCGEEGYVVNLNHNNYTLLIKIELTAKRMFEEVELMSRKMVPANMVITVELRYRQHKELKRYTHGELKAYKHKEIREEELT